ncbi:MAG: cupin-like domain-containing protein [Paucibacter sp.]|nr:cupin-like domain-containing protein [Roseateles sp.]
MKALPERHGLDPHALPDEVLNATTPVVLRGLTLSWPATQAARRSDAELAAYLRQYWQDATVGMLIGPPEIGGRFFYNQSLSGFNFGRDMGKLDAVLDTLLQLKRAPAEAVPALYVGATTVDTCLPGFRAANDLNLGERDALASLWLGNRSRIAAHFDAPDNLACVVAGRRRFTLFPPDQLANLYVGPLDFTPAGQAISLVDFHAPDFKRFPRFAQALEHAQVAELEAGDAIFIPSMWWHHIEALAPLNLLVNYWWSQAPEHMDSPMNALMLALLTMRELPPAQREAWAGIFNHYVFTADAQTAAHIPPDARHALAPIDAAGARQLRAHLLNRLKR